MAKGMDLVKPPKADAFTRISQFMTGKGVVLSAEEETILNRWIVTDQWMRQNKLTTDEICDKLQTDFAISRFTALGDIRHAQKLFAMSRMVNKQYVGHLHLERINKDIEELRERIFWEENKELPGVKIPRVPDPKEMAALARMHEAYTHILNSMPDGQKADAMPPPVFVFNLVGKEIKTTMDIEEALNAADNMINGTEYTDFEDLNNGGEADEPNE